MGNHRPHAQGSNPLALWSFLIHDMANNKRRPYTTKLPSQLEPGDKIMLQGSTSSEPVIMEVLTKPDRPDYKEPWLIHTDRYPKGCTAEGTLRIPLVREDP